MNQLLQKGRSNTFSDGGIRQLCVVYSGGDDVFLVGAWNDVLDAAADLKNAFERYTEGTLTISCGVGLCDSSYPINRMALETAELEDYSKKLEGKNAITLFEREGRYSWDVYQQSVLQDKYRVVHEYMTVTQQRGKAFLYHLLDLLREAEETYDRGPSGDQGSKNRFNRARFVYFLSRMEPEENRRQEKEQMEVERLAYRNFSQKMYEWSLNAEDRRQLISVIYLYVYLTREREGDAQT